MVLKSVSDYFKAKKYYINNPVSARYNKHANMMQHELDGMCTSVRVGGAEDGYWRDTR